MRVSGGIHSCFISLSSFSAARLVSQTSHATSQVDERGERRHELQRDAVDLLADAVRGCREPPSASPVHADGKRVGTHVAGRVHRT